MNWPDIFLLCFSIGALWSFLSVLLGGFHLGHWGSHHTGFGHAHAHGPAVHGSGIHAHGHASASTSHSAQSSGMNWLGSMLNPSCVAIFLAWFGGVGYLLTRHSGWSFAINLTLAILVGVFGAWLLAAFLRFLQSREHALDPADYEMVGVLGRVASSIRPNGVGEVIYTRDGARRPVPARSDEGQEIRRGEEVIVTRYEKGVAYVRTWEAMTQDGTAFPNGSKVRSGENVGLLEQEKRNESDGLLQRSGIVAKGD